MNGLSMIKSFYDKENERKFQPFFVLYDISFWFAEKKKNTYGKRFS